MAIKKVKNKLRSMLLVMILVFSGILIIFPLSPETEPVSALLTWTQTSNNDFQNGTFDNVVISGVGDAAKLKIEVSGFQHWMDKTPSTIPTNYPVKRYDHDMATIADTDKVLMYGGWASGDRESITWVYDLSDDTWTDKQPSNNPGGRTYHSMASVFNDDKVVLFGGTFNSKGNDTWVYDLSDNDWIEKTPQNPTSTNNPIERFGPELASIWGTDKVVLFGGSYAANYYDDLWIFDISDDCWTEMTPLGRKPGPRSLHSMASIDGTDKLVLYGGNQSLDDTWVYDLSENKWTEMVKGPSGRTSPQLATVFNTDNVVLFGGQLNNVYMNKTWVFDYNDGAQGRWTEITVEASPLGRQRFAMVGVNGTDKTVLFGGGLESNPWQGEDTWIYKHDLNTQNGTYISEVYDTCSNSTFKTISWEASTPVDTSIKFQLRTAINESNLESEPFVGPNGSESAYYLSSPSTIRANHTGDRLVQYKVHFNINGESGSPNLKDVTITYNCLPQTMMIGPVNGSILTNNKPVFKWIFKDYDSYSQKAFQVIIDDDINFDSVDYNSGERITQTESWHYPSGTSYIGLPDGLWYWKVRTKDEDDSWTEYSTPWEMFIDTTPPNSISTSPINNGFYYNLELFSGSASDPVPGSGVLKVEIAVKRISDNFHWDGSDWGPIITWLLANGTEEWTFDAKTIPLESSTRYSVQARATDLANLVEIPYTGNMFIIDMDHPISTIDLPLNNTWVNEADIISGNCIDVGGSGTDKIEICIQNAGSEEYWDGNDWCLDETWLIATGTEQWSYDGSNVKWSSGNEYVIHSRAIDYTGNKESPSSGITFKYDARAPEKLAFNINKGSEFTSETDIILSLYAEDIGSEVTEMSFSTDGSTWTPWESFNTSKEFELPLGDGEKTVYFRVRDFANNIAESVFDQIILDTEPPEKLSIIINDDAKYTNSNILTLTLKAVDKLSGLGDITLSFDTVTWLPWESFKGTRTISLPEGTTDGETRVYFKVNDKVGNIANAVFDSIILDNTPPQWLSNIINGGATEANSTQVILELDAQDSISDLYQMSFSIDGETWSEWEEYAKTKSYELPPGHGMKTIYFRVKDHAGNIAEPITTTILLNLDSQDSSKNENEPKGLADTEEDSLYLLIATLFILIVIVLIAAYFLLIIKHKKVPKEKLLLPQATTVIPDILPTPGLTSVGQITPTPVHAQLHATTTSSLGSTHIPTGHPVAGSVHIPQQTPQIPHASQSQLPQLPPAQVEILGGTIEKRPQITEPASVSSPTAENAKETSITLN